MADSEASKLNLVNLKLISQMASNSGMAGRVPGYIGKKYKEKAKIFNFLWRCDILIFIIMCLYVCLCVFEYISMSFVCI